MIKAIETVYNGYRFRSRLEARWAVFFDTLGIKYEYEKEGYDLDGTWYLPDFWLPELDCWIEIKGQEPTNEECERAVKLARDTKKWVYLFFGDNWPDANNERSAYVYFPDSWKEGCFDTPHKWSECPKCGLIGITFSGWSERLPCLCKKTEKGYHAKTPRLMTAYTAARQARFEHGETPQIKPSPLNPYVIASEFALECDRKYFQEHPGKYSYTRPYIEHEAGAKAEQQMRKQVIQLHPEFASFNEDEMKVQPVDVIVRQIREGVRTREFPGTFVAFSHKGVEKLNMIKASEQANGIPFSEEKWVPCEYHPFSGLRPASIPKSEEPRSKTRQTRKQVHKQRKRKRK